MALSKLQLSQLLSTYGAMLTQKQRDIVAMYCDCDCTLSEVASEQGISRRCEGRRCQGGKNAHGVGKRVAHCAVGKGFACRRRGRKLRTGNANSQKICRKGVKRRWLHFKI